MGKRGSGPGASRTPRKRSAPAEGAGSPASSIGTPAKSRRTMEAGYYHKILKDYDEAIEAHGSIPAFLDA
eukprot:4031783-Lingulodinium_polyedra.AAC.1